MSKKLLIVPLLVTAMFVFVATAAQAAPAKWAKNGTVLANGKPEPIIAWGTLSLTSAAGTVQCKNAAAGTVENIAAEPQNFGPTSLFAPYECTATGGECPVLGGVTAVVPEATPWGAQDEETALGSEKYRGASVGNPVQINFKCLLKGHAPEEVGNLLFKTGEVAKEVIGTSTPLVKNGTTAGKPSETEFDKESGHLQAATTVEVGEKGETTIQLTGIEHTEKSATIKGKELAKRGVKVGQIVNGQAVATNGNKPNPGKGEFPPLTTNIAVSETEATLGLLEFNAEKGKYEFKGKLSESTKTATETDSFTPGEGAKEVATTVEGSTKGSVKYEGYEGTPVPLFTLVP